MFRVQMIPVLAMALAGLSGAPANAALKPAEKASKTSGMAATAKTAQQLKVGKSANAAQAAKAAKAVQTARVVKTKTVGRQAPSAPSADVVGEEPVLMPEQLVIADRVMVGIVACEFGQNIEIAAVSGKPGHFVLKTGAAQYALVPYETSTGAVRLEDRKQGVVWLQIPTKSMLLSERLGQRLVDNCVHETQRSAVVSSADGLGIAEPLLPSAGTSLVAVAQAADDTLDVEDALLDAPDLGNWPGILSALWPATPPASLAGWMGVWTPPFDLVAWVPTGQPPPAVGVKPVMPTLHGLEVAPLVQTPFSLR